MPQKNITTKHIVMEHTEDCVEPSPPGLTSHFQTVNDWLLNILQTDKPQKPIDKFKFGLFESPDDYELYPVGVNTYYEDNKLISTTLIEFEPTDMYFKLPKTYFGKLDREQLLDNLISQLKDFSNTEKFKNSFFTKANIVVFETNGQTIWSK